jgi:protein-S-isoprenylcysteine O-methyltransferase Ste14
LRVDFDFRVAVAILFALTLVVRTYYQLQSFRSGTSQKFEGKTNAALRGMAGLALFALLAVYLLIPQSLAWASLPFPAWLRWLGAPTGFAGLAVLFWVHRELGRNFSGTLHLRAEHQLITSGPYRRMRHPMYTAFYLVALALLLLSANWLLGGGLIVGITAVMASRVKHEEEVMTERFGAQYRDYMAHTGRFLPRLRT